MTYFRPGEAVGSDRGAPGAPRTFKRMHRISTACAVPAALYRRTGLTLRGLLLLMAAAFTLAGTALVLAVTSEDVVGHNGMATDDPQLLWFITDHRTGWLVSSSTFLSYVNPSSVERSLSTSPALL